MPFTIFCFLWKQKSLATIHLLLYNLHGSTFKGDFNKIYYLFVSYCLFQQNSQICSQKEKNFCVRWKYRDKKLSTDFSDVPYIQLGYQEY